MAGRIITDIANPSLNENGKPISGATLTFFLAGTTTLGNIYTTPDADIELPNPLAANDAGRFAEVWADDSALFDVVWKSATGVPILTLESISAVLSDPASSFLKVDGSNANMTPPQARAFRSEIGAGSVEAINVRDFYEDADPDWTNAFERAIYEANPDDDAINLYVPAGDYTLSRQIIPRRLLTLTGAGNKAARLNFHNVATINSVMKGAFAFGIATTLAAYTTNPSGYAVGADGSDRSLVEGLEIIISGTRPSGFDYGIWNAARLTCRNVQVSNAGFKNVGGNLVLGAGVVTGNSNLSMFDWCHADNAREHGFVSDGDDANAITFISCNAFQSTTFGFNDGSGFGNTYIGCHASGGVTGYRSLNPGGSNRCVYLGCYMEGSSSGEPWDIATGCTILAPFGAQPNTLSGGRNTTLVAANLAGLYANRPLNITDLQSQAFDIGDATHPAIRLSSMGLEVRGGDGSLGSMIRGGDGVYIAHNGGAVMKVELGALIANASNAAGAPTQSEFNALVTVVNTILTRMRAGTPNIAP